MLILNNEKLGTFKTLTLNIKSTHVVNNNIALYTTM